MSDESNTLSPQFSELENLLNYSNRTQLYETIIKQSDIRFSKLLEGIEFYQNYQYKRHANEGEVLWKQGSAELRSYGAHDHSKPIILFIPSLINRSYVLNLNERLSMVEYLKAQNMHPMIIDWNDPLAKEHDYSIEDYVNQFIEPIVRFIHRQYDQKIIIAGYCLGGILSLASYHSVKEYVSGMVLMATPWDFNVKQYQFPRLLAQHLDGYIDNANFIHKDMVQLLFYYISPRSYLDRYIKIADLTEHTQQADDMIAIEQWSNDGIHLTKGIARDCLIHLCRDNLVHKGKYFVNGRPIDLSLIDIPVCIITASKDRIVPFASSTVLAAQLPQYDHIQAQTGHVSLVASSSSQKEVWEPLKAWIHNVS
ncbi:MAG: alpha/beta fold hydrolase [Rickettsiales bacterium]|nr:alpha/beta fold hydrolase [Rickettsiales bacterium]